ncbi:MAG: tyrosine-protein phosphatase [Deltaproteobacteria bacterium]|nr:tyrosine-protein phosphatase [Deltaproteobacteria bacterium]
MNRTIDLAGCHNFRDLGGYPTADGRQVRWRQVFRSDALHHLTAPDVARLRDEIGLGTIIDLRSSGELSSEGRGPLGGEAMTFHHLPLFEGNTSRSAAPPDMRLADLYGLMADFARQPIGRVLTTLADSDAPAVYHCAAGKDRTGVISAILLSLLGVADEVIVADYAVTRDNLDAIVARLMSTRGYQEMLATLPPDTMHAEPETMIGFLARLRDQYGSAEEYARSAGVAADAIGRLRARLVA